MPTSRCSCTRRCIRRSSATTKLLRIYRDIEMPVMEVLFTMERNGVLLDCALLDQQSRELGAKMIELENRRAPGGRASRSTSIRRSRSRRSCSSSKGLPVRKKTPGGQPSTDEDVLQELALDHPLPKLILEYRGLSKLKSTYTDKLPRMVNPTTGRVHTNYGQAVAVTGRLASNDPNLQNIPVRTAEGRRIREAFIAPPGSRDRVGRLFADRAAHHGAPVAGRGPAARRSPPARTCIAIPHRKSSASNRRQSPASSAATPR